MVNIYILYSSAAIAAIAIPALATAKGLLNRKETHKPEARQRPSALTPTPVKDHGWQFVYCDDPSSFNSWLERDEIGLPPMDGEEISLGSHLLVELYGCDEASLKYEQTVGMAMKEAARESEATIVADSFHEFQPYGVSGAVIIQESHYTIHTWPEHGYAAVDLFYCGGTVQVHRAINVLRERFRPQRIKFLVVRRGLQHEVQQ